jgi:hypothetical protein
MVQMKYCYLKVRLSVGMAAMWLNSSEDAS